MIALTFCHGVSFGRLSNITRSCDIWFNISPDLATPKRAAFLAALFYCLSRLYRYKQALCLTILLPQTG